jgi:hypothetical protein
VESDFNSKGAAVSVFTALEMVCRHVGLTGAYVYLRYATPRTAFQQKVLIKDDKREV